MSQTEDKTIDQLNEEADIAADYLEGLLDIADYDGDIEMGIRNDRPLVQIVADDNTDIKNLIGKNGSVVDALQQLTRLAVQQKTGERSRLIVDVDGYLKRKRLHLRNLALDAIDEARESGEAVDLAPMNSFERKVIHDIVREEGLKSRSHGEEPHRYVSVYMRKNDEAEDSDAVNAASSSKAVSDDDAILDDTAVGDNAVDDADVEDTDVEDTDVEDGNVEDSDSE
ncbi:protein jag [Bifidobacterium aquikefiricola]|uniref:Jag family protein n=1 Tax=Bifidobacterium TaxID=1678 RepID=UPI0038574844